MLVAHIIVLANVSKRYSYIVPDHLSIAVGDFVDIIFAKRQQIGLCVEFVKSQPSDFSYALSEVLSLHSKRAAVPLSLIHLVEWFADYYCVTEYKALQCIVGLKKVREDQFLNLNSVSALPNLSDEQFNIFKNILDSSQLNHLIHGVTGSGKTLIYSHLIHQTIAESKSAIVLIPEISLTPQFTTFFSDHFSNIAVVHSGLTPKKKEMIWNQCLRGEIDIIIGPRSALFMPLLNLGLLIVDEEHDTSYKQENNPRYLTHDVAIARAKIQNARLIFGSATPSLTTFAASKNNEFQYHSLTKRFNDISMPQVTVLDMKQTQRNFLIHDHLLKRIEETLTEKKKILLLVNRRGYSSFLKCNACSAIQMCKSCETSYTYHSDGYFRCHRCLATKKMSRQCTECGKYDVEYYGIAIQKIEYELNYLFSKAKISRIDRDTVKNFEQLEAAIDGVEDADILIGTQMISKGHNFKNVALVGIVGVDTMLNFPDFRASERMFQLMTQMAGRAGRDMSGSEVYIQTFQPNHYVFSFIKSHDVHGFLNQEFDFREPFGYPPFKSMVNVILSSKDQRKIVELYKKIQDFNHHLLSDLNVVAVGPKVAPIEKISGYFRHNVFYKVAKGDEYIFKQKLRQFPTVFGVRLIFDINPVSLL